MHRGWSARMIAWLLLPAASVLACSALGVPGRPYTGLIVQSDRVAAVIAGSPADRAGILPGDRLAATGRPTDSGWLARELLADAAPGRPLLLERRAGDRRDRVWLAAEPLPDSERRMLAALLVVSSGFVLLAGLVWSERRDRLTRTFFLLCLAFAWLIAPLPQLRSAAFALVWRTAYSGITLFLPALFVHFFAMFPEPARWGGRLETRVRWGYGIAAVLFATALLEPLGPSAFPGADVAFAALQVAAAVWFTLGLIVALALFGRSYFRARSADERRRLRVALAGTVLGAGPLAALILIRNLSPGTAVPGERWAVMLTLLVPASFAWAVVVHHIFDFRMALRAGSLALMLGAGGALAYLGGEWIALHRGAELGAEVEGLALASVPLVAGLAGPLSAWVRGLRARLPASSGVISIVGSGADHPGGLEPLLSTACGTLAAELRLDGCAALALEHGIARDAGHVGETTLPAGGTDLARALGDRAGVVGVDEVEGGAELAMALERGGVRWIVPVGESPRRALLLLGRRLAGAWLGQLEARELERFADHLAVALENRALRREASSHGALERELREAGAIQAHRLPRRAPVYPTLDCAAATLSCESVGGDYYDFVETAPRDFTLAVGDAAGKGVPAALVLAGVQARFRDEARRALSPGALLDVLNRELVGLDQPEKFMGLLCARIEVRGGRVWLANAGLTPPLVRRRDGRFEELTDGGVLLGVSVDATYPDVPVELGAGDLLLLCTDGLTEAQCGDELFGTDLVREVLDACPGRRAADVLEALLAAVRAFADRPLDDLTVVVLRQLTEPARGAGPATQKALKLHRATAEAAR
jgi:serine phosphatase RsbU (regulator of sigma subunit)